MVQPKLDELPVYVHAGSIIPMQPITQSTEETPNGPLTLRIFPNLPGKPCAGEIYQDDGKSFDFRKGVFLRIRVTCNVATNGSLTVTLARREGSFQPWWKDIQIEVVGLQPRSLQLVTERRTISLEKTSLGYSATIPSPGDTQTIIFR